MKTTYLIIFLIGFLSSSQVLGICDGIMDIESTNFTQIAGGGQVWYL